MNKRDAIAIQEWERFLSTARRAGASDDTMVEEEADEQWTDVVVAYKIDAEPSEESPDGPETVVVPAEILHGLLFVTRQVASSDGDLRGLEGAARRIVDEFNEHFLTPVLGPNPYAEGEQEIAELVDQQRGGGRA